MNGYKQNKRPLQPIKYLLSILFMLLLLPLTLTHPGFASAAHSMAVSEATPTPTPIVPAGFAHARVSVVRLLVSYIDPTDSNRTIPTCTGLGVLVKSLPVSSGSAGTTPLNDWVLTDGSLVDPAQATCADLPVAGVTPVAGATPVAWATLSKIQISFNTTSNGKSKAITLDSTPTPSASSAVTCSASPNCSNGPALIAFHGDQVASVDVATSSSGKGLSAIALTDALGTLPNPGDVIAGDTEFLTPRSLDVATPGLEAGTPFIDAEGHLAGLQFAKATSPVKLDAISSFVGGIQTNKPLGNNPASTATPVPPGAFVVPFANVTLEWWQWTILVALLLLVLVILLTALAGRLFTAELAEAERRAAIREAARRAWEDHHKLSEQPIVPIQQQDLQDKVVMRKTLSNLGCPRCGEPVTHDANYCPNCRLQLTHSESGPHLSIPLPTSLAQSSTTPTTQVEFDAADIRADINVWQIMEQKGE